MPKFAISLIGMRRPEGTRTCLQGMIRHAPADTHFFLTANGCPATAAMFRQVAAQTGTQRFTLTENAQNLGFQEPHSRQFIAASQQGFDFVLIANDDLEVPAGFLQTLVEPMLRNPQCAITGPEGNCAYLNHDFHGTGGNGPPEYIEGSLSLVRVETIQQLRRTLWCPGLRFVYSEDSSLSLFVREKGYEIAVVPMRVNHLRSVTVNGDPETKAKCAEAQRQNHEVNRARWAYYIQHRRFDLPILIKRSYAIGDVILMEPIIRAIRKSRPLSPIHVQTDFPELFSGHPNVVQCAKYLSVPQPCLTVDLDGAYEHTTETHIVEAYWRKAAEVLTGLEPHDWVCRLHPSAEDMEWAESVLSNINGAALLAVDPTTWSGKNWPAERMEQVARKLNGRYSVCAVGSKNMVRREHPWMANFVGQTTLMQLAALCAKAKLMVTPDTSTLHIAQAMGCPVVGLFGVTRARCITTQGSPCAAVESDEKMPASGLRHRITGVTYLNEGAETMNSITVEQVIEAIEKLNV